MVPSMLYKFKAIDIGIKIHVVLHTGCPKKNAPVAYCSNQLLVHFFGTPCMSSGDKMIPFLRDGFYPLLHLSNQFYPTI